jgi:hypothetical protein
MSVLFDWDDANIAHIEEHDVTPAEAEEVVTTFRSGLTRVVTAYPAGRSLVVTYQEYKESMPSGKENSS